MEYILNFDESVRPLKWNKNNFEIVTKGELK